MNNKKQRMVLLSFGAPWVSLLLVALWHVGCGPGPNLADADWPHVVDPPERAPEQPFIDWANLKNPVLVRTHLVKNPFVMHHKDNFYVFAGGRVIYKTQDFKDYEVVDEPNLRGGAPSIVAVDGTWYMAFNDHLDERPWRRIGITTSQDLEHWSEPQQLLPADVLPGVRIIDGTLTYEGGHFYTGMKAGQQFYVTRSRTDRLEDGWLPPQRASADGRWAEAFHFMKIDGRWVMIATAHTGKVLKWITQPYTGDLEPFIYFMDGDGSSLDHWQRWKRRRHLKVPYEDWNRVMHANSAYLADWREHDGFFYLFYSGANDHTSNKGRGHGKIGVVRSRDLVTWYLPGDMTATP